MVVAADLEAGDGSLGEIGRLGQADLLTRVDGEQMGDVAVRVVGFVAVRLPFLKLYWKQYLQITMQ